MKVLVAGATGKTGLRVVRELAEQGHEPIAMVRESSDTSELPRGVAQRTQDLTNLSDDACDGCDAVIFAAGSGSSTGPEMTDKIDRDGAIDLVDVAKQAGVQRFVMLSSVGADNPQQAGEDMAHYLQAKHDADEYLMGSGLDYAILRPVALTERDGRRDVRLGDDVDPGAEAARGDVAALLARAVTDPALSGKAVLMQSC
ncbi:SDR family oxidoreductase [Aliishimia ponticola]|uniref:SDR family oxidoreductase n=1 Tax=Aliishimia ponticola TaxID=2499833 RepID=A0A4S4NBW2_9RHOB|nr:SDR family oxidoreductase [Aliishimia ponticola]THH36165.1 SDR family oxidoreductase [Aliishimia ponticola]